MKPTITSVPCVLVSEADLTMLLMKSKRVDELEKDLRAKENVANTLRSLLSDSVVSNCHLNGEIRVLRQSMKDIGEALRRSGVNLTTLLAPEVSPWNRK